MEVENKKPPTELLLTMGTPCARPRAECGVMTRSLGFGLSDKVYVPDRKHAVTPGGVPATAEGAGEYESLRRGERTLKATWPRSPWAWAELGVGGESISHWRMRGRLSDAPQRDPGPNHRSP